MTTGNYFYKKRLHEVIAKTMQFFDSRCTKKLLTSNSRRESTCDWRTGNAFNSCRQYTATQ